MLNCRTQKEMSTHQPWISQWMQSCWCDTTSAVQLPANLLLLHSLNQHLKIIKNMNMWMSTSFLFKFKLLNQNVMWCLSFSSTDVVGCHDVTLFQMIKSIWVARLQKVDWLISFDRNTALKSRLWFDCMASALTKVGSPVNTFWKTQLKLMLGSHVGPWVVC